MKNVIGRWIVGFIVVSLLWLWASSFQLRVGEVAVVTRFGDPRRIVEESGLYFKLPVPIERAVILDARRRVYETRFAETLTKDKKNVILSSYIVWAVGDPLKFIQAVGTLETAEVKLDGMVSNAKNAVMGKYELSSLVSTD
ncbi:protease modulator HflC, partial [candidate division TA06 bacterium]